MDICRLTSEQPDNIKMVEIDFQALCRICGALGENLTSVFGKRAADRLRERIGKHLKIEILAEDCLPTKVCDGCRETLDHFHELFEKCHRTDEKFRTMMNASEELKEVDLEAKEVSPEQKPLEEEEDVIPSAKKVKVTKRVDKQEDTQEDVAEKKWEPLRHSIENEDELQTEALEEPEDFYGDYQFLEPKQEEEDDLSYQISLLGRAPTTPLSKEFVERGKVVVAGKVHYQCAECGKKMISPYTYQAHLRIHTGEKPFTCLYCQKTFRMAQGLGRHVREVHEKMRKYPCDICGRRFGNRNNLKEHRFIHTNERPYCCERCGKSYNQKAALFMHRQTHDNQRNFICPLCSKGFRTRSKLLLHETTHSEIRSHECCMCDQKFRSAHDLARHRKCHTTDKPFQCDICDGQFKQKRYLTNHIKTHHVTKDSGESE